MSFLFLKFYQRTLLCEPLQYCYKGLLLFNKYSITFLLCFLKKIGVGAVPISIFNRDPELVCAVAKASASYALKSLSFPQDAHETSIIVDLIFQITAIIVITMNTDINICH